MFGKKKEPPRKPRPVGSLAQYGIFEVPEKIEDLGNYNDPGSDDEDLEAELAALTAGDNPVKPPRRKAPPPPKVDLDAMINESLKDDEDDDEDVDEDDPELTAELHAMTGTDPDEIPTTPTEPEPEEPKDTGVSEETKKLVEERLQMYKTAVQKAKERNDSGKMRRYQRGLQTLQELNRSINSGHAINTDDIPPILPNSALVDPPPKPAEPAAPVAEDPAKEEISAPQAKVAKGVPEEVMAAIKQRQQEYKVAALSYKKAGNMPKALEMVTVIKQFDMVFKAIEEGLTDIDLSEMPPPPVLPGQEPPQPEKEEAEVQSATVESAPAVDVPVKEENLEFALKTRLEVYRRTKVAAEEEGNTSKARRYGRICKQFEDALKLHKAGKPVPLDELPTPPGFPPIETVSGKSSETPSSPPKQSPGAQPKPSVPQRVAPAPPAAKEQPKAVTRADKQAQSLEKRQRELKLAALKAKQDGDLELARDYLRQAKGIQPLINASKAGLPVDMNSIPLSPDSKAQLNNHGYTAKTDDDFTLVSREECVEAEGTDQQIYENMEKQLLKQIKWCLATRDHCKALGDVPGYNRWERLALAYSGDLDFLRVRKRDTLPPPQHHYEIKTYSIVKSCTDVNSSDIQISILRGVNYPKETDTYVIYEYPLSSDNHQTDRTATVKSSSNPEYNAVFTLNDVIDRNNRQCQRVFKRHALKCQIWEKGCSMNSILCCTCLSGFFRGDRLLGTVTVKLQALQAQCVIHDSFPLMDGRKATGGKLEVKIRLRNPISTKQIEQITDKWLIIDH